VNGISSSSDPLWQAILKALLAFSFLLGALWFFYAARSVLLPFFLAGVFAYVLSPLVAVLQTRGLRRDAAVVLVYLVLTTVVVAAFYALAVVLWQELPQFKAQWPGYVEKTRQTIADTEAAFGERLPWLKQQKVFENVFGHVMGAAQGLAKSLPGVLSSLFSLGLYMIIIPFAGFFFLRGGRDFFQSVLDYCPGRWVEKSVSLFFEIDDVLGHYLRGVIIEAAAVGVLASVGLWLLGVDHALLIGTLTGLGNLAPYVGPIVGGALGAGVAFFQFGDFAMPLKVVGLFAAVQFIDNWFFQPVIMRRSVNLHPVSVLVALLCGGQVAGGWGLLLAVPALCVLKETGKIISLWYLSERGITSLPKDIAEAAAKPYAV